jgi:hypothetical protein
MRRGLRRVVTVGWSASRFRQAKNDGCEIRSCRQNSAIDRPDRRQRPMRSCHLVANVALAARPIAWPCAEGKNKNFLPAAYPTRQAWTDGALTLSALLALPIALGNRPPPGVERGLAEPFAPTELGHR